MGHVGKEIAFCLISFLGLFKGINEPRDINKEDIQAYFIRTSLHELYMDLPADSPDVVAILCHIGIHVEAIESQGTFSEEFIKLFLAEDPFHSLTEGNTLFDLKLVEFIIVHKKDIRGHDGPKSCIGHYQEICGGTQELIIIKGLTEAVLLDIGLSMGCLFICKPENGIVLFQPGDLTAEPFVFVKKLFFGFGDIAVHRSPSLSDHMMMSRNCEGTEQLRCQGQNASIVKVKLWNML